MRKCLQLFKCPNQLINYLSPPTYQDLKIAVLKGDPQKISLLIQSGAPLFGNGQTILHYCITQNNHHLLAYFCQQFPDLIDQRNDDGDNPYMMSIFTKYKEASTLLREKSNLNICDNNGNTAFMIAAANGDFQTVKKLLQIDRQIAYVKNFQGQNALHRACYYGQIQIASHLVRKTRLKFGMKDRKGNTSLHLACKGLSYDIARYIIKKVQNWKDLLRQKNRQNKDALDLMLQSLQKIGQKSSKLSKNQLQKEVFKQVIDNNDMQKDPLRDSEDKYN